MANQASAEAAAALPLNLQILSNLGARQKLAAMAAVALSIALITGAWLWLGEPPYGVLFSNLEDKDAGAVVASLQQQNVPYKYSEGGGAILVPQTMVHDVRLRLASAGLPGGGLVGFEVMENQKLGISQFAEQINYQRGLEGELSRSIQSLAVVTAARVHLAIPKRTSFLRDQARPSASVLVNLRPGRSLEATQIAGIVHLVSSSVPQLRPDDVSVIDQNGVLVSQVNDPLRNAGLDAAQLTYVREIESMYQRRVEAILTPVVGAGNYRAQITADIDFSRVEQVEELYDPNQQQDSAAVRSEQSSYSGYGDDLGRGIPGAMTNKRPLTATAPLDSTNPEADASPAMLGAGGGAADKNRPINRNSTTNYEVDKTVRHTRAAPGGVRRLSVAIVVNHRPPPGKEGAKPQPPSAEEIERIDNLVREAVGFSDTRGDSINVAAASFAPEPPEVIPETPLWSDPTVVASSKEYGQYLLLLLLGLLVWVKLLKPVFSSLSAAAERMQEQQRAADDTGEDADSEPEQAHEPTFEEKLERARETARNDPKLVAELIKEWMGVGSS